MARNSMLPMKTGSGLLGKIIGGLIALAVLSMVIKYPTEAASWVTSLFHWAGSAIDGISTFLAHVVG